MISKNQFKLIKSLKQKKFRAKHSLFLVEGYRNCEELLRSDFSIEHFFYTEDSNQNERFSKLISKFRDTDTQCEIISPSEMSSISDAVNDQGVLSVACLPEETHSLNLNEMNTVLCLESISDPGNLGAIIRTAAWFSVDSIILSSDSADRFNPKVVRASAGAIFQIPIFVTTDLSEVLDRSAEDGFTTIATSPKGGTSIYEFNFPDRSMVLFGSEADGLSDDLISKSGVTISIPTKGIGESLNLAISCGIVLCMMNISR